MYVLIQDNFQIQSEQAVIHLCYMCYIKILGNDEKIKNQPAYPAINAFVFHIRDLDCHGWKRQIQQGAQIRKGQLELRAQ